MLLEIALAVQQRERHQRNAQVRRRAQRVAGQHAQAARVGRHRGLDGDLHGEVGHQAGVWNCLVQERFRGELIPYILLLPATPPALRARPQVNRISRAETACLLHRGKHLTSLARKPRPVNVSAGCENGSFVSVTCVIGATTSSNGKLFRCRAARRALSRLTLLAALTPAGAPRPMHGKCESAARSPSSPHTGRPAPRQTPPPRSCSTRLMVQPPNPPPVSRAPISPGRSCASSTMASASTQLASKSWL